MVHMARRWTQAGQSGREESANDSLRRVVRSETPSELRRLIGLSLVTMGAVLVILGSQAPFMAFAFGLVFALFALQAAMQVPAARRAGHQQKSRSR
jgi:hypothetical protein